MELWLLWAERVINMKNRFANIVHNKNVVEYSYSCGYLHKSKF